MNWGVLELHVDDKAEALWFDAVVAKVETVETCNAYDAGVPPLPADGLSVGVTLWPLAPVAVLTASALRAQR